MKSLQIPEKLIHREILFSCARSLKRSDHCRHVMAVNQHRSVATETVHISYVPVDAITKPFPTNRLPTKPRGKEVRIERKAASTFMPSESSIHDVNATTNASPNTQSFLQAKAQSVMLRRAEVASMSSMTSAEKKAFKKIWKMVEINDGLTPVPTEKAIDQLDVNPENVINLFIDHPTNSEADPEFTNVTPKPSISGDAESIALDIMKDISVSLDATLKSGVVKYDVAIWDVCESKIFPLIKLLTLPKTTMPGPASVNAENTPIPLNEKNDTNDPSEQLSTASLDSSLSADISNSAQTTDALQEHPLIPQTTPLIPLLSIIYPAALLLIIRLYQIHSPASPYARSLLPHIKSLGPTSYVLGANTYFYNALLSIEWDVYSDLNTITNLLIEMDRMGVGFDAGTMSILTRIGEERQNDLRGEQYPRVKTTQVSKQDINTNMNVQKLETSTFSTSSLPNTEDKIQDATWQGQRSAQWWKRPLVHKSWTTFNEMKNMVSRKLAEKGLGEVMREGDIDQGHQRI